MSTSLLYHGFGIRGYRYVSTNYLEGAVVFSIEQERYTLRCSACGSARLTRHGGETRLFRSLPIGNRPTHVLLQIARVECHDCLVLRQVPFDFAEPRRSYTHAFERYALELGRHMTIQDVAKHLQVSWDTMGGAVGAVSGMGGFCERLVPNPQRELVATRCECGYKESRLMIRPMSLNTRTRQGVEFLSGRGSDEEK